LVERTVQLSVEVLERVETKRVGVNTIPVIFWLWGFQNGNDDDDNCVCFPQFRFFGSTFLSLFLVGESWGESRLTSTRFGDKKQKEKDTTTERRRGKIVDQATQKWMMIPSCVIK
jgi:hypothetical protein